MVGVADRVAPLELAQIRVVERAAAEADNTRFIAFTASTTSARQPPFASTGMSDRIVEPERPVRGTRS